MKWITAIVFFLCSLSAHSQQLFSKNGVTFLVDEICSIRSTDKDCFIEKIPLEYRLNQKDTIKYCFDSDSCFVFYKGKCDTVCWPDTTELYFYSKNFYHADTPLELENVGMMSKAIKDFEEPNLWASSDSLTDFIRLTILKSTNPVVYRIERNNKIVFTKKISNGSWLTGNDSLRINVNKEISAKDWNRLISISQNQTLFKSGKNFKVMFPNVLIETKINGDFKFVYFYECPYELSKSEQKAYKRLLRILNSI